MDFNYTEEQQMLKETILRLVRNEYGFEDREKYRTSHKGYSEAFWQQLAELGLLAMPFAEEFGGFDGNDIDLSLVMTELGRGLCLEPYLQSVILAGGLLSDLGSEAQKQTHLTKIADGSLMAALAHEEPQSHYILSDVATSASKQGDGYILSGHKAVVLGGSVSSLLLVSARTSGTQNDMDGISLFLVDPAVDGVVCKNFQTIDAQRGCDVILNKAPAELLGEEGAAYDALNHHTGRAISALCAEAVGAMEEAVTLTCEYLKTREQFGQPIGRFQALQHRMVDMLTELEQARSMAIWAAAVAGERGLERDQALRAAKNVIGRAGKLIAEEAIQLHGGIGMTWEYTLSHTAKRLIMINHQFGDEDHHLEEYAKHMAG